MYKYVSRYARHALHNDIATICQDMSEVHMMELAFYCRRERLPEECGETCELRKSVLKSFSPPGVAYHEMLIANRQFYSYAKMYRNI